MWAVVRGLRRDPWIVVNSVLLVGLCVAFALRGPRFATAEAATPADLFMQSIAAEDGDLGWQQLCPEVQQQLPREVLVQQSVSQRTLQDGQGLSLSIEPLGDRPTPSGGRVHVYIATAHGPDGAVGQKVYSVTTRSSGCVEMVSS
jgi:hypothetical protein